MVKGTKENPVVILEATNSYQSVPSEYEWVAINYPDWKLVSQALSFDDGIFDIITIEKDEEYMDIYFDISHFENMQVFKDKDCG